MSLSQQQQQILSILCENLDHDPPQLVAADTIAGRMNLKLLEVRRVLRTMEGQGVIETDPDQQFTLITREGLQRCLLQSAVA
jgi:DNA-binding MarR family transcriptional regulator